MAESYCLKACAECGMCAGCHFGDYVKQCDIAKCCEKKNHQSCDSCMEKTSCITRRYRDTMPRLKHEDQKSNWSQRTYVEQASDLATGSMIVLWCLVVQFAAGFLQFIPELKTALGILSKVMTLGISFGFLRMSDADARFAAVASLHVASLAADLISTLTSSNGIGILMGLVTIVCSVIALKVKYSAFEDALSGISAEMSGKWYGQWNLYLVSFCIVMISAVLLIIRELRILGGIGMIVAILLVFFTSVREMVYLHETAKVCRNYESGSLWLDSRAIR